MKKTYNYITIVKTSKGYELGKNTGTSCNRRNAMDKAHNRDREIVAAVNLLNSYEEAPKECIEMVKAITTTYGCDLLKLPIRVITAYITKVAKEFGYAKECIEYTTIPMKRSY